MALGAKADEEAILTVLHSPNARLTPQSRVGVADQRTADRGARRESASGGCLGANSTKPT